jgi:hypothetical protein
MINEVNTCQVYFENEKKVKLKAMPLSMGITKPIIAGSHLFNFQLLRILHLVALASLALSISSANAPNIQDA